MEMLNDGEMSVKPSKFKTDALNNMDNLKLLQLNSVQLTGSYENFSEDLRWLCWFGYHLETIPCELFMGNLVAIDMSCSKLIIFEPPTELTSLKILNLKDSNNLLGIHNMFKIPHLEILILWNCHNLIRVCETIRNLKTLALLNMTGCEKLFKKVQTKLLAAQKDSTSRGGVAQKPTFFFLPHSLHRLSLNGCNLECTDSFHLSFSAQPSLQYLNLGHGLFEFLPDYTHLENLRVLDLSFCSRLKSIKCLPSTLAELLYKLSEVEGLFKLVPVSKLEESDLGHMKWLKEYQDQEVCLVGDDELTKDRSLRVQMLYEFNIMSTSLPDIKDPNMQPDYVSELSSLSFNVNLDPKNRRLKGLDVAFRYRISGNDWAWFCKISTNNGVDLMYNPKVFGKPDSGKVGIWLSYWPIGSKLNTGDKVDVSISVISGLEVHEFGVSLFYTDDQVATETLERNMDWEEILGGDMSGFQLSTRAFYLCRHDFFGLMEVGRLSHDWFRILVGDAINHTEVRRWRNTGRPKQLNPSFTELKTISCIIHGPQLEEVYKITKMSESYFIDKTLELPSSMFGKTTTSATSSRSSDTTIKELNEIQNVKSMDMSKTSVPNEIQKSTSSSHGEEPDSLLIHGASRYGKNMSRKVVLKVDVENDKQKNKALKIVSSLSGVESISIDMKDKKLTVIGDVDPVHIAGKLRKCYRTDIVSVGPAKEEKEGKEEDKHGKKEYMEGDKKAQEEAIKKSVVTYQSYTYNSSMQPYYSVQSAEEDPNACVIC